MEFWKEIPNYEGLYEASNLGKVRSKEGKVTYSKLHGKRVWKSRILKEKNKSGRDVRVDLWKNGEPKSFLVHRLVAETFIPNTDNKPCINHIDGNPRNNYVSNLEWVTYSENMKHAFKNGLYSTNVKITLINKQSGNKKRFISMSEASRSLGKGNGYISDFLYRGKTETKDYFIVKEQGG